MGQVEMLGAVAVRVSDERLALQGAQGEDLVFELGHAILSPVDDGHPAQVAAALDGIDGGVVVELALGEALVELIGELCPAGVVGRLLAEELIEGVGWRAGRAGGGRGGGVVAGRVGGRIVP